MWKEDLPGLRFGHWDHVHWSNRQISNQETTDVKNWEHKSPMCVVKFENNNQHDWHRSQKSHRVWKKSVENLVQIKFVRLPTGFKNSSRRRQHSEAFIRDRSVLHSDQRENRSAFVEFNTKIIYNCVKKSEKNCSVLY